MNDDPTRSHRRRRRLGGRGPERHPGWRAVMPLVVLATGALFAVSAENSQGTDLRPGRYTDLASLVRAESQDYEGLRARVETLTAQVDALAAARGDEDVRREQRRTDRLAGPAGLSPITGAGVRVVLSDAPSENFGKTDLNPNLLVVHQQDIQAVVNAMWRAGARAVTVQGQRIVTTTGIKCEGNSVTLQGVPYPSPYVIEGVGDVAALERSLDQDHYLQLYRRQVADPEIGIGWDEQPEASITAPAYDGLLDLSYARPA